jgi:hypothetical protein
MKEYVDKNVFKLEMKNINKRNNFKKYRIITEGVNQENE